MAIGSVAGVEYPLGSSGLNPDGGFPSPFFDQATLHMPDQMRNALQYAEYVFCSNGTYRMAQERIIAYFLTDVDISSGGGDKSPGDDEREKWENFFETVLHVKTALALLDLDVACYGNGFATLVAPFKRFLVSSKTKTLYAFREMAENEQFQLKYDASSNKFFAKDPQTQQTCEFTIHDEPDDLEQKLRIKTWSPHEIEIVADPWTGDCDYVWKIPDDYRRELQRGNLFMLERCPKEVLDAVQRRQWFKFAPGTLYHMKERTLSGISMRGWGLSRTLINFRDIWHVQVLRRFNEAIALDYIIPFRVITPEVRGGRGQAGGEISDPIRMTSLGDFNAQIRRMLRRRRRDPASWHALPFPIQYQALGGDAQQLAPHELLDQGQDILLNAAGTPAEMYRGTLQLQTAPVSLRLFEATHYGLVHNNNCFLAWVVDQVSRLLTFVPITATMRRVTHADDFNKQMAALQLFMGQQLSGETALRGLGFDWKSEMRQIAEEAKHQAELQANVQEEMDQAAYGEQIAKGQGGPGAPPAGAGAPAGGTPAGGDPAATGQLPSPVDTAFSDPNVPITPDEMLSQAAALAQELLGLPASQRNSELRRLKQRNEVLHSLVTAQLEQIRSQARSAGGAMLLGEQPAQPMA